ncbi:unnamed protein product [Ectocarpus sp. 8 AP-2014]
MLQEAIHILGRQQRQSNQSNKKTNETCVCGSLSVYRILEPTIHLLNGRQRQRKLTSNPTRLFRAELQVSFYPTHERKVYPSQSNQQENKQENDLEFKTEADPMSNSILGGCVSLENKYMLT